MTEKEKKRVVYIAGMLGYMEDKNNFLDVFAESEIRNIVSNLEKLINKVATDNDEFRKLYKDVLDGVYEVNCYRKYEVEEKKRRMLKSRTKVDKESLYTIAENAMGTCQDCKRLKSKCALRKAMLKAEIPAVNDGKGKCEYNWREE